MRALVPFFFTSLAGCGPSANLEGTAPDVTYKLERAFTGQTANALLLSFPEDSAFQFRLSGDGLSSALALDKLHPMTERIAFNYASEGAYTADIAVFRGNGTPYLADSLSFAFSTKRPDEPVVTFSETATNDTSVTLQIVGELDPDTTEIGVDGVWSPLSASGIHLMQVSSPDGIKNMSVKLRNIYGNESLPAEASILKKSSPPTDCAVEMPGQGSATSVIDLKLYATNDGPVYYAVLGDVATVEDYKQFTSGSTVSATLSGGAGLKKIKVRIRDIAGNFCDEFTHSITVSSDYVEQTMAIADEPFFTESQVVELDLRYDHYSSEEPIEMKITGDLLLAEGVNEWVPYATSKLVTMSAAAGQKKIFAQFRDNTLTETFLVSATVYLKPEVDVEDAGGGKKSLKPSRIKGTKAMTITGCAEAYVAVEAAAAYECTPTGAAAVVTYTFTDDTTLVKNAAL